MLSCARGQATRCVAYPVNMYHCVPLKKLPRQAVFSFTFLLFSIGQHRPSTRYPLAAGILTSVSTRKILFIHFRMNSTGQTSREPPPQEAPHQGRGHDVPSFPYPATRCYIGQYLLVSRAPPAWACIIVAGFFDDDHNELWHIELFLAQDGFPRRDPSDAGSRANSPNDDINNDRTGSSEGYPSAFEFDRHGECPESQPSLFGFAPICPQVCRMLIFVSELERRSRLSRRRLLIHRHPGYPDTRYHLETRLVGLMPVLHSPSQRPQALGSAYGSSRPFFFRDYDDDSENERHYDWSRG